MKELLDKIKGYNEIIGLRHHANADNSEIYRIALKNLDGNREKLKKCQVVARIAAEEHPVEDTRQFLNIVALYSLAAAIEYNIIDKKLYTVSSKCSVDSVRQSS